MTKDGVINLSTKVTGKVTMKSL